MSDWLSLAALLVAVGGTFLQWKQTQRIGGRVAAIESARRAEELESRQRAAVSARFDRVLNSQGKVGHRLVIQNAGPAGAREVNFEMGPEAEHGPHLHQPPFPIAFLAPGQEFAMWAMVYGETVQHVTAHLSWLDDAGAQRLDLTLSVR